MSDKENIRDRPDQSTTFPIVIVEWDRNSREIVDVALDRYNGRHTINAGVWYHDGGMRKLGKSSLTLAVKQLALAEALWKALKAARELGLPSGGAEQ